MPRLGCTVRHFLEIIAAHGFILHRQGATSHRRYKGEVGGKARMVDVSVHGMGDMIPPKTLKSMIRQCGLPESLFRR